MGAMTKEVFMIDPRILIPLVRSAYFICPNCNEYENMEISKISDSDASASYPRADYKCIKCNIYYWKSGKKCK